MRRALKIALALFLLLSLSYFPGNTDAEGGNYIILRAYAQPYYIENQSMQIMFYIVVFREGKPTNENVNVHIDITGINVNKTYSTVINIRGGKKVTEFLPGLPEGHYRIEIYAEKDNITSEPIKQDFGVTKPPVPYECFFDNDGSKIYFKSLQLNKTGDIDPNFTFTLYIYVYQHGTGETLVQTLTNTTKTVITIPDEWKQGIVYVDVVDRWGWRNSANADFQHMQFEGIPISYDYLYEQREPYQSRSWMWWIAAIIVIIAVLYLIDRMSRRDEDEYR